MVSNLVSNAGHTPDKILCHKDRLLSLHSLSKSNIELLQDENQNYIAFKTYSACVDLHEKEQEVAILNPICRDVFRVNLHPDLDVGIFSRVKDELDEAKQESYLELVVLEEKLRGLSGIDEASNSVFYDSLSEYELAINACK